MFFFLKLPIIFPWTISGKKKHSTIHVRESDTLKLMSAEICSRVSQGARLGTQVSIRGIHSNIVSIAVEVKTD